MTKIALILKYESVLTKEQNAFLLTKLNTKRKGAFQFDLFKEHKKGSVTFY